MPEPLGDTEQEVRFRLPSAFSLPRSVLAECDPLIETIDLIDIWYIPAAAAESLTSHEEWLLSGSAAPVRIRFDSKASRIKLEAKVLEKSHMYNETREVSVGVSDVQHVDELLRAIGFTRAAVLHKHRILARHRDGVILCVDDYGSEGAILEAERGEQCVLSEGLEALQAWVLRAFVGTRLGVAEPVALRVIRSNLLSSQREPGGLTLDTLTEYDFMEAISSTMA